MSQFHLEASHLRHLNHELALLVAQIDQCCSGTVDQVERRQLECSASLAHDLLDKMVLAEQASAPNGEVDEIVAALEKRLRESEPWIAGVRDKLERIEWLPRADRGERPADGGSTFGNASGSLDPG